MKNIKRQSVEAVRILATFLLPLHLALADPIGFTQDAERMGCIVRQPGSAKFIGGDLVN